MTASSGDVFGWIEDPPVDGRALHFASPSWNWLRHSYGDLARLTIRTANGLVHAGLRHNDVVVIISPTNPGLVAALFGTMLAGATACIIAPPRGFETALAYDAHLLHVTKTAAARMILTTAEQAKVIAAVPDLDVEVCVVDELILAGSSDNAAPQRPRADLALLQFTSGSSGQARGVRLTYDALQANVAAIRSWLDWSHQDTSAFWVPHYHDMGLIGGLIAPLVSRCDVRLLTPEQFVRRPLEYLRCFGQGGARLTALPAFGLDYIVRRVRPDALRGMDFSGVKAFVIGAELIGPATLTRFGDLLGPFGLPREALLPAYGLAEATLAVSGVSRNTPWAVRSPAGGGPPVVGCGRPLDGLDIAILDEYERTVPEGEIGEIVVHGPSVAAGYHVEQTCGSLTSFRQGSLYSGDAGFVSDGQLFPIGRLGDSIKIRGQAVFAELLEYELSHLQYPRTHTAVLLGVRDGCPVAVWVIEDVGTVDPAAGLQLLSRLAEGAEIFLVHATRGTIPRTSSGKPRRRVLWSHFIHGQISGTLKSYTRRGSFAQHAS